MIGIFPLQTHKRKRAKTTQMTAAMKYRTRRMTMPPTPLNCPVIASYIIATAAPAVPTHKMTKAAATCSNVNGLRSMLSSGVGE